MILPWRSKKPTRHSPDLVERAQRSEVLVDASTVEVRASARRLRTAADTLVTMNQVILSQIVDDK